MTTSLVATSHSADGRGLFYLAPDGKVMAVPVKVGATLEPGAAVALFDAPRSLGFYPYDVSPDGRFLFNVPADADTPISSPLTIVVNWREGLNGTTARADR